MRSRSFPMFPFAPLVAQLTIVGVFLMIAGTVWSRPWRPAQIPNGTVFNCANCHVSPLGGGPRTPFGEAVAARVDPNSMAAFWSAGLAGLDSDGDGLTNGGELRDPDGDNIPLDSSGVSNPGVPLFITLQPQSRTVNAGVTVTFSVTASGDAPIAYQWRKGGVNLANDNHVLGATTATLTLYNVQSGDVGAYDVLVSNGGNTRLSASASLSVNLVPPAIISQPESQSFVAGSTVSLSVAVSGTTPLSYQWRKNGVNLADDGHVTGATSAILSLHNAQPADEGNYTVLVVNTAGSATSDPASLTLGYSLTVSASGGRVIKTPDKSIYARGETVTLRALPESGWIFDRWSGAANSTDAEISVSVQNDLALTAHFIATELACTPVPPNVRYWWPFVDDANDVMGEMHGRLFNGASVVPGHVGNALRFDGVDDYVEFGGDAGIFASEDFTIEFWVKTSSTRNEDVLSKRAVCAHDSFWAVRMDGGMLYLELDQDSSGTRHLYLGTIEKVNNNRFRHVAFVRQSSRVSVYLDGTLRDAVQPPWVTALPDSAALPLAAGRSVCTGSGDGTQPFTGLLDELSLYGRALTSGEIRAINDAGRGGKCLGIVPPPVPSLVAWWPGDLNGRDIVGANQATAVVEADHTLGKVGWGFRFSSSFASARVANSPDLNLQNAMSVEGWVKMGAGTSTRRILTKYNSALTSSSYGLDVVNRALVFWVRGEGGVERRVRTVGAPIVDDSWIHVAGTFDAASQSMRLFTNGAEAPVTQVNAGVVASISSSDGPLLIGSNTDTGPPAFAVPSEIDELSLYNRALTPAEIGAIHTTGVGGKLAFGPVYIAPQPVSQTVPAGGSATFTVGAAGSVPLFYQWRGNGADIPGATTATYTRANLQVSDAGNYSVLVSNDRGAVASASVTLTVVDCLAQTGPASEVGAISARLNGMINPIAHAAWAWFEYGLTTAYDRTTPPVNLLPGTTAVPFNALVGSLARATTFHFRLVATNDLMRCEGADMTFATANPLLIVTNTNDTGPGSLRQAMLDANGVPGPDRIVFNIEPAGVQTIRPLLPLPRLTDATVIDAQTQPGFAGAPIIELDGSNAGSSVVGVEIVASNCLVRGLVVNNFSHAGIFLSGSDGIVEGNYIGTDVAGLAARPAFYGVFASGRNHVIGGTNASQRNIISGNQSSGVILYGSNHVVAGNFIGVDITGTHALGNGGPGVIVATGPGNNRIGGDAPGAGNIIAFNQSDGVTLAGSMATNNVIQANSIFGNNGLGISLSGFGLVTPNDPGDADPGANGLQNFPVLTSAVYDPSSPLSIWGTLSSRPDHVYRLDFYGNAACDSSGHGEGRLSMGFSTITTDASGNASFKVILPRPEAGMDFITATATDYDGNTSEFSACRQSVDLTVSRTFVVVNTNDSGAGSLRQAILDANVTPAADTITFNIPSSGPKMITPLSPLPGLSNTVTIDAATQPGFSGQPIIELNGANAGPNANGLVIRSDGCVVRGLVINQFRASGIDLVGSAARIEGNYIGTDRAGRVALSNSFNGIQLTGMNNRIGGTTASARNIIAASGNHGIRIIGRTNLVLGNLIGTDATGTNALGNGNFGVAIGDGTANQVGRNPGGGNRIAFNRNAGVGVGTGSNNVIRANVIFANGGLGIDHGFNGVSANDPGDADSGPNSLQNFPVLTAATNRATELIVTGTLNSAPGREYEIDFYASSACDAVGYGEGSRHLGSIRMTTDGNGNSAFHIVLPPTEAELAITATATDPDGNTSEFSACLPSLEERLPQTFTVTNTNDSGPGSLRQALLDASASIAPSNTIAFNIGPGGIQTLRPLTELPRPTRPLLLDGWTQPGFAGKPIIEISGQSAPFSGLSINASNSLVRGLVIHGFGNAIQIIGSGGRVEGCYVGTDVTGMLARTNAGFGILVSGSGSVIGGSGPAVRNIISGNFIGVSLIGSNCVLEGNFIGTDATGAGRLGNSFNGILVPPSHRGGRIGGESAAAGNIVAFNGGAGVSVPSTSSNLTIRANAIFSNDDLGIDLGGNGVSANDAGDLDTGPNGLQNFPVLSLASNFAATVVIEGTLNSRSNANYELDFYANATCDSSGHGEGESWLGTTSVTTDGSGNAAFDVALASFAPAGSFITATARDSAGNTSEFSPCQSVIGSSIAVELDIVFNGEATALSWPASAVGYVLEYTEDLTSPVQWHPVSQPVFIDGSRKFHPVEKEPDTTGFFYRLRYF